MQKPKQTDIKPSSKNIGPFLAFDKNWFAYHQKKILWLLNAPIIKYWSRWILRIHNSFNLPMATKVDFIFPHYFGFNGHLVRFDSEEFRKLFNRNDRRRIVARAEKGHNACFVQTTDFRTHPKFAKRIYFAFKPIWWAMHYWDEFFADSWVPGLSFGFSTLTVYPDAGSGATTCDSELQEFHFGSPQSWGTIRGGAGTGAPKTDAIGNLLYFEDTTTVLWDALCRSGYTWDTSALTSVAIISAATQSHYDAGKRDGLSVTPNANIYGFTPTTNNSLVAGDFAQCGSTAFSTAITYSGWGAGVYNDFALNATGISNISLTGITRSSARNANYDVANTLPVTTTANDSCYFNVYFADQTGTSNDPKLVVTYTANTDWTKVLTESLVLTDTVFGSVTRILIESFGLTNVLANVRGKFATLTESIGLTDTFSHIGSTFNRTFTETLTLTASFLRAITRVLTESFSLTALFTSTITKFLGVVHMRSKQQNYPKAMDKNNLDTMRSNQQSSPKPMDDSSIK